MLNDRRLAADLKEQDCTEPEIEDALDRRADEAIQNQRDQDLKE